MGLEPRMEGLVVVASSSVSWSSGGWLVLVLGACFSPGFAVNVKVPSAGSVGES
jgi:hypothetical protein